MSIKAIKPAVAALAATLVLSSAALVPAQVAYAFDLSGSSARAQLPNFVDLVEKYGKGVVNISTVRQARVIEQQNPFAGMDERQAEILKRFGFPMLPFIGPREEPERRGTGSGFIISSDGLILTNHHVVDGADTITVRLTDEREFTGKVLGSDPKTDIAVVKIDAKDLPVLKIGNSDNLKVGEWVAAIGSPFGLDNTVTAGIVSAKSRKLPSDQYVPFIQTDVAVNPGNSGGPLFNMDGEVVGINSQIFSTSGGFMGLSFAIPIDLAMQIKDQLVKHGKVTRGRIGVVIQDVTPDLADTFGLKTPKGAIVSQLEKNGPAAKGGLREGDVIIAINGKKVNSSSDMPMAVSAMKPGDIANLQVIRDGKEVSIKVTVAEAESQTPVKEQKKNAAASKLGVTVRPLNEQEQNQIGSEGLLVMQSSGAAKKAGILEGDIIVNVNGIAMKNISDLSRILEKSSKLRVLVQRRDGRIFIPVRLK